MARPCALGAAALHGVQCRVFSAPRCLTSFAASRTAHPASHLCLEHRRSFATSRSIKDQFNDQLAPEDILHLRATSMTIMQDPICELRPEEARQYLVDRPADPLLDGLPLWHPTSLLTHATQPSRARRLAVGRFNDLIIERLDNDSLCAAFGIDNGFNMQVYFMMIHTWLLHQRLVLEGQAAKRLDEDLFEACWTLVRNWLWLKKTPEYRFDAELQNVQEYMLGCCVALDKALERPDVLPARVQQVLWGNVYSGAVKRDAASLTRLTKYLLRQLGLMLQLDAEHFLAGNFVWASFPVLGDDAKRQRRAPGQLVSETTRLPKRPNAHSAGRNAGSASGKKG